MLRHGDALDRKRVGPAPKLAGEPWLEDRFDPGRRRDDDRVVFVHTFSKNWAMTGWRVGWIEAPPELGDVIENLIQYSTSGVAVFIQRAAVAALPTARLDLSPLARQSGIFALLPLFALGKLLLGA